MNTPAHLLIGAAALGRNRERGVLLAAIVGGLLPDVSLYLMAGTALYVFNIPPQVVFDELYFSEAWQTVFAIDNSFVIWGALFAIAFWKGVPWALALTGAAFLHLCLDFPLHHDDGRPHFWPISPWVFESPLSYWGRNHGALWVAPLEVAAAVVAAVLLWCEQLGIAHKLFIGCMLALEFWVVRQWLFYFIDA